MSIFNTSVGIQYHNRFCLAKKWGGGHVLPPLSPVLPALKDEEEFSQLSSCVKDLVPLAQSYDGVSLNPILGIDIINQQNMHKGLLITLFNSLNSVQTHLFWLPRLPFVKREVLCYMSFGFSILLSEGYPRYIGRFCPLSGFYTFIFGNKSRSSRQRSGKQCLRIAMELGTISAKFIYFNIFNLLCVSTLENIFTYERWKSDYVIQKISTREQCVFWNKIRV